MLERPPLHFVGLVGFPAHRATHLPPRRAAHPGSAREYRIDSGRGVYRAMLQAMDHAWWRVQGVRADRGFLGVDFRV